MSIAICILLCGSLHGQEPVVGVLDMKVEGASTKQGSVTVQTTGAEFVFDESAGRIECSQKIPLKRKVAVVSGLNLKHVQIDENSSLECRLSVEGHKTPIVVGLDSLLTIPIEMGATIAVTGTYAPAWPGIEKPHFLLPDEKGGVGIYLLGNAVCEVPENWKPGWCVRYKASQPSRVLVSVFPPKPFDWKQSCETMLHSFSSTHPYPSDQELEAWSKYGKVLTLHSWIWKGGKSRQYGIEQDGSWTNSEFDAKSDEELLRVARTCHRLSMKVIAYLSPYYQGGGRKPEDFAKAVGQAVKKYELDGAYFDGVYNDIESAYEVTRQVRKVIGDKGILYIHSTQLPLKEIYCPFLDCYANYILRGEHLRMSKEYARWKVSCWNLSNSVGTFCYDRHRPDEQMIDGILSVNARLPIWVQDGTWNGTKYHLTEDEMKLMASEYLPRLEKENQAAKPNGGAE
jgi:hypothetical protein